MGHPTWPLYDLRLRTPDLELRLSDEAELVELCRVARSGVHEPDQVPFPVLWTQRPSPQFEREFVQHHWRARAAWTPQRWRLILAVFHDGAPVGCQDVVADDFAVLREVRTGSWLGLPFQGRGFGKQMRAAVLHLAFAGLTAVTALTSAFADNPASLAVTRALGYEPNGVTRDLREGTPAEHHHFRLTRERWRSHRYCEVEMEGLDACRDMFGA